MWAERSQSCSSIFATIDSTLPTLVMRRMCSQIFGFWVSVVVSLEQMIDARDQYLCRGDHNLQFDVHVALVTPPCKAECFSLVECGLASLLL